MSCLVKRLGLMNPQLDLAESAGSDYEDATARSDPSTSGGLGKV